MNRGQGGRLEKKGGDLAAGGRERGDFDSSTKEKRKKGDWGRNVLSDTEMDTRNRGGGWGGKKEVDSTEFCLEKRSESLP